MTYEQQIKARKDGKWIVVDRNFKFIACCNTEKDAAKAAKRGYKTESPLIKRTVTKEDIYEYERIYEKMRIAGRGY